MKKFFILALFVLSSTLLFAQNDSQDVVYLKDGSIIRGLIIEQVINKSIKIETNNKNVFVYQMDEIDKITKEPIQHNQKNTSNIHEIQFDYRLDVELGYQKGIYYNAKDRLKLNVIYSYQPNPYFSLGLGTGIRQYFSEKELMIPVFVNLRANFIDYKFSPYVSVGAGYSFGVLNGNNGILFDPTLGVIYKVSDKHTMNLGISFENQRVIHYEYYDYSDVYDFDYTGYDIFVSVYSSVGMVVGISF